MKQTLTTISGAPLSRYTFGTMQFGDGADANQSRGLFDACRTAGINHFDTAHGYTQGASETLLGQFATSERDKLYIATKAAFDGGASAANVRAQFDISRKRLGLDVVDLLYIHRWDDDTALEDTFTGLAELQQMGLIRHIGVSNFAAWQVMKAQAVANKLGTRIDVIQPMYNLVKRQSEVEILPMATDQGMLACTFSPLGAGLLTGKYAAGGTGRLRTDERYKARYEGEWMFEAAEELAKVATEIGTTSATLAVAWCAAHPTAPSPIISARTVEQLGPSLEAARFDMTPEIYARLTALAPTPPLATDRQEEQ